MTTIVWFNNQIYGKPTDKADAKHILQPFPAIYQVTGLHKNIEKRKTFMLLAMFISHNFRMKSTTTWNTINLTTKPVLRVQEWIGPSA